MPKHRAHGDGEIRKRSDGRWEARLRLSDGKRKSLYGKTRREVQIKLKQLNRDIDRGLDVSNEKLLVKDYLSTWLESERDSLRPSTWKSYESYLRVHIVPQLGHFKLRDLSATHVNKMLSEMATKGLSPRSRNYARAVLRKALNDAVDADLLPSNAAAKAKSAKEQNESVVPLTPVEVKTLLTATRDHWMGPLIHVAIGTGLRQGELLALKWQDVDFQEKSIKVQKTLTRLEGKFVFSPPKTHKSNRKVYIDDSTLRALERQATQQEEAKLAAGSDWNDWGLVFSTTKGTPQHNSNVTHRVQKLMEEAGVPRKTFHNLRHSAASLLYANGADIKMIQEVLGHSQIALTANTYTHLDEAMRKEAAVKMSAALSGLEST